MGAKTQNFGLQLLVLYWRAGGNMQLKSHNPPKSHPQPAKSHPEPTKSHPQPAKSHPEPALVTNQPKSHPQPAQVTPTTRPSHTQNPPSHTQNPPSHTHNPPKSESHQDALERPSPRQDYVSTHPKVLQLLDISKRKAEVGSSSLSPCSCNFSI
jgi:hypothetical protein